MAAMLVAVARLCRERPPGAASVILACTVDEEFTHTGSSRLAETRPRRRSGGRRRADGARPGALPQGRPAVEDPHAGRGLPQLDACISGSTPSTGWAGCSDRLLSMPASWRQVASRPDSRAAQPLGRPDRGGTERQRGSRLVRDRGRSPADPGRRLRLSALEGVAGIPARAAGQPGRRSSLAEPWVAHARPGPEPRGTGWGRSKDAVKAATGREPKVVGVPYGTDAGPLGALACPAWSSAPATSRRHTPRTNGSSSTRCGRPRKPTIRSPCDLG